MKVRIKNDGKNWGFVEKYDIYKYQGKGFKKAIVGISLEGSEATLTEPYIFRRNSFEPLRTIEKEMGIEKYIKAKKPFYSLINEGLVVSLHARVDFETGEYIPEDSKYIIYTKNDFMDLKEEELFLTAIPAVPKELDEEIFKLMGILAESDTRADFFRKRMEDSVVELL